MINLKINPVAGAVEAIKGETADRIVGQVLLIPADRIRITDEPNRIPDALRDESFQRLKESIDATRGNVQPVQVHRRVGVDGTIEYVLITGRRRAQACRETGHPVRAEVTEHIDDRTAFLQRLAENALRQDLSPYERGRQIQHGFEQKLFTLESEASRAIGVDKSDLNKLRRLGRLDQRMVAAFPCPSDLQFKHAKPLTDAVASKPQAVLAEADRIAGLEEKPKVDEVVALLVAAGSVGVVGRSHTPPADLPLNCDGQSVGQIRVARNGLVKIELDMPLERKEREQLVKVVETFVRRRVLKAKLAATAGAEVQV
jgi:ParB/RepB/Spo0J family partition protein